MTLIGLLIRIGIAAIILTLGNYVLKKAKPEWVRIEKWWLTFLQNFCGALFIFSGYVKAVDPKGTAYKMEQYFGEFTTHFSDSLVPVWHYMSEQALAISLIMIIMEIVLGVMLLFGYTRKFTAWLFLLLIVAFTFLTGFTYLTGYVPEGVNFFSFGEWGDYKKTNMKVTDCGCFGDFIKLEPKISFYKDLALLVPGILFLILYSKKHILFTKNIRNAIVGGATLITTVFCFQNTFWNLPMQDFRPFKNGTDVRSSKLEEEEMEANAEVFYLIKQKDTGETRTLSMNDYLAMYGEPEFKTKWETVDQIREDVPTTKISDFMITGDDGGDITERILDEPGYHLMAVAYQWKYTASEMKATRQDTVFAMDTTLVKQGGKEGLSITSRVVEVNQVEYVKPVYAWDSGYLAKYTEKVNPVFAAAAEDGHWVYGVTKPYSPGQIQDFQRVSGANYPFYTADDILLKTIVRSNPGVVLWKDGRIIKKWHISHLPDYAAIKAEYMR